MTTPHAHLEWNDRLQDWLDGDLDAADTAALQAHMADCAACRARADELQAARSQPAQRGPAPGAGRCVRREALRADRRDRRDEARRSAPRIEQELQQNLQALARGWRRALLFIVPGVIAGVALAFALAWWLDTMLA